MEVPQMEVPLIVHSWDFPLQTIHFWVPLWKQVQGTIKARSAKVARRQVSAKLRPRRDPMIQVLGEIDELILGDDSFCYHTTRLVIYSSNVL